MSGEAPNNQPASSSSESPYRDKLLDILTDLVEPIGMALHGNSEVVLHDLSSLPNSVVAVFGSIGDRELAHTDLLLKAAMAGFPSNSLWYETRLADGREFRCSTLIIRDEVGEPIAGLCINTDVSAWAEVARAAQAIMNPGVRNVRSYSGIDGSTAAGGAPNNVSPKAFIARDLDQLATNMIDAALASVGVAVELMKKEHKLDVVRQLKTQGLFSLRGSVETVAQTLHVTRFTVYNYINEVGDVEPLTEDVVPGPPPITEGI